MDGKFSNHKIMFCLRAVRRLAGYMGLIILCPLLGAWLDGKPLGPYLRFPPIPERIHAPSFSWFVFFLIAAASLLILAPFLRRIIVSATSPSMPRPANKPFPVWGWLGLVMMLLAWIVAWNRFQWVETLQEYTFTPLWLSYILVVNGLTYSRSGHCLLRDRPRYLLLLFFVSAYFWWSFEFLNRFVQNWYYVGIADFGPGRYFLYATLPFATVLPAVLGTAEWLQTFPKLTAGLNRFSPLPIMNNKVLAVTAIGAASIGLIALAIWPRQLYSLVWLLPIVLVIGLQSATGKPKLLLETEIGDWRRVWLLAIAGLVCGFFWEMWNANSLAHWRYSIPYVQRFEIFAMPLLGYLGYLPFGILCGLFADFVLLSSPKKNDIKDPRT